MTISSSTSAAVSSAKPDLNLLTAIARRIRRDSIRCTTRAGSGHPSSSISAAELITALFFTELRYDFTDPKRLDNDRFVLSKGHAAPLLYSAWAAAGLITDEQLMSLRLVDSNFEGHPTPRLPWIDVATGSLGQGLPNAVGMAWYLRNVVHSPGRVFVLCGDGELAEGSNWEAAPIASELGLGNLTALIDINRLEQSVATRLGWDLSRYAGQFEAFGWETLSIDGHDLAACIEAIAKAARPDRTRPLAILAKTKKGGGISFIADHEAWHGKPLDAAQEKAALAELAAQGDITTDVRAAIASPTGTPLRPPSSQAPLTKLPAPSYPVDKTIATRKAYGEALKRIGDAHPGAVVFDGDVKNSTFAELFEKAHKDRFVQCYIAEQAMLGLAIGAGAIGALPYTATFAAFLTRAYDQIRMAALSQVRLKVCGSHAGTSIGEDGASQMGLEDLAMFRALYDSTVVYPADPYATESLLRSIGELPGVSYLRATRAATAVLYGPGDSFPIGGSKTLKQSDRDACVIVAAGITLHESLKAHAILEKAGIAVRVIDAYSVKPIDEAGLRAAAAACGGNVVVVEDHWIEGGLGDAVLSVFAESGVARVKKIAVTALPHSGKPEELLELYGLSGPRIAEAVQAFLAGRSDHAQSR